MNREHDVQQLRRAISVPPQAPLDSLWLDETPLPEVYEAPEAFTLIVEEWRRRDDLYAADTAPAQTVLVVGPSGVGKTTGVRWVAAQMKLPLYVVSLGTVMGSHLGETAQNMAKVFDFAVRSKCVMLLDELDSLATDRAQTGTGQAASIEFRHTTNAIIQLLDRWMQRHRDGIVFAATNLEDMVDYAIRRRFEETIVLDPPSKGLFSAIAGCDVDIDPVGMSIAEFERIVRKARRSNILFGSDIKSSIETMCASLPRSA